MNTQLKLFGEKLLSINPSYTNIFGTGLPGMGGSSAATSGASSSASDIVVHLQANANKFVRGADGRLPQTEWLALARAIEGDLLTLQALGCIQQADCEGLIDELHSAISGMLQP